MTIYHNVKQSDTDVSSLCKSTELLFTVVVHTLKNQTGSGNSNSLNLVELSVSPSLSPDKSY